MCPWEIGFQDSKSLNMTTDREGRARSGNIDAVDAVIRIPNWTKTNIWGTNYFFWTHPSYSSRSFGHEKNFCKLGPQMSEWWPEACKARSIASKYARLKNIYSGNLDTFSRPINQAANDAMETLLVLHGIRNFVFKNLLNEFLLQFFGIVSE